jgi:hypothetical protein
MNRFKEPSTWAGIAGVFQALKAALPPQWAIYLDGATLVAGSIAAAKADPGAAK